MASCRVPSVHSEVAADPLVSDRRLPYLLVSWLLLLLLLSGCPVRGDYSSFVGNYSALRNAILTSAGYDVKIRPNTTVAVRARLSVLTLNSLEIKGQVMSVSGWLSLEWIDERLTWTTAQYDNIRYIFDNENVLWRPELTVDNSVRNVGVIHDENLLLRVRYDGLVAWEPPRLFETSCSIDVTSYPFDEQRCSIDLVSWTYPMEEVTLTHLAQTIDMEDFQENGEWSFVTTDLTSAVVMDGSLSYSQLRFWLVFRRRPAFLVVSVLLPIALTGLLSVLVFALPLQSGEKVSYALTVLLSYAVLLTIVSDNMPSTSTHLAVLNLYMAAVLSLGCLTVLLTVVNLFCHHHHPHPPPPPWLLAYTRKVLARSTGSHQLAHAHTASGRKTQIRSFDHDVTQEESSSRKAWTNDVTEDLENTGSDDVTAVITWQDIASLHDAFCLRVTSAFVLTVTVVFYLALIISGYTG